MAGYDLTHRFEWRPARDPVDETFGSLVERSRLDDASEYDSVLVGEPYDGAVLGRRGARTGPRGLRRALSGTKTHHFDAGPLRSVGDLGDMAIRGRDDGHYDRGVESVQDRIRETTERIHDADALPVFLGGDNSTTYANVAPLLDGSVGVISFDAHLDCRELHDGPSSGTPYRQLLEAGLDGFAVVGARHFETSTDYHRYCREQGGTIVTAEECAQPVDAVERALSALSDVDRVYLSVDLDVLDAPAAPGVSAPTPGGISSRELYRMLRVSAADDRLAGLEVVECAPRLEDGTRTTRAGARAIAHALASHGANATVGGEEE